MINFMKLILNFDQIEFLYLQNTTWIFIKNKLIEDILGGTMQHFSDYIDGFDSD